MLDLGKLDVDEIATALSDQTDYEHRWLIDPRTGEVAFWTSDTGIDGENPVELDELDLVPIDPRLARAIRGKGAFRRFKDELFEEYPELVPAWQVFRDARAKRRAVEWLLDEELIQEEAATTYLAEHPDPPMP